jgi:hypothetical protein
MSELTENVCKIVATFKIAEIIKNNATVIASDMIYEIMLELAQSPQSIHPALTVDQTVVMVCEEKSPKQLN